MGRPVCWRAALVLAFLSLACEREIPPMSEPVKISGYRLEGLVADRLGNAVRGVAIALHYDYYREDEGPPPSKALQVVDRNAIIHVLVFDRGNRIVRRLFQGRAPLGPLVVEWDRRDAYGNSVPSGIYSVQYIVNGEKKGSYPVTVSGTITARTDSMGHYVILDENLPVGFYPVPLYTPDSTRFLGNYRIASYVLLEFYLEPRRVAGTSLVKHQITRLDLKL